MATAWTEWRLFLLFTAIVIALCWASERWQYAEMLQASPPSPAPPSDAVKPAPPAKPNCPTVSLQIYVTGVEPLRSQLASSLSEQIRRLAPGRISILSTKTEAMNIILDDSKKTAANPIDVLKASMDIPGDYRIYARAVDGPPLVGGVRKGTFILSRFKSRMVIFPRWMLTLPRLHHSTTSS